MNFVNELFVNLEKLKAIRHEHINHRAKFKGTVSRICKLGKKTQRHFQRGKSQSKKS